MPRFSPTAESFGVSAQIGSGVVRGSPEVRFHQGSTRVPPGFHQGSTRFYKGGVVRALKKSTACCWGISPELILSILVGEPSQPKKKVKKHQSLGDLVTYGCTCFLCFDCRSAKLQAAATFSFMRSSQCQEKLKRKPTTKILTARAQALAVSNTGLCHQPQRTPDQTGSPLKVKLVCKVYLMLSFLNK